MKRVLSMMMAVVLMAAMLSISVFANEPQGSAEFHALMGGVDGTDIASISTNAPDGVTVDVKACDPGKAADYANDLAAEAGGTVKSMLSSFEIIPSEPGDYVMNVRLTVPNECIGDFLAIIVTPEDGEPALNQCIEIVAPVMNVTLTQYGVITPVIIDKQLPGVVVAPETGPAALPVILGSVAVIALGGFMFAKKRCAA